MFLNISRLFVAFPFWRHTTALGSFEEFEHAKRLAEERRVIHPVCLNIAGSTFGHIVILRNRSRPGPFAGDFGRERRCMVAKSGANLALA